MNPHRFTALWQARNTASLHTIFITFGTISFIIALRKWIPKWPGMLLAITLAAGIVWTTGIPIETVGSKFGGLPNTLLAPKIPEITWGTVMAVMPAALSFTLLGAIESLLSAVVADGMSGTKHRPNTELFAQGIANMATALFGGFCVTGTIARTATNIRAGAFSPVAGMLHAVFLLGFMLFAAPLASYIPLSALAGVLAIVAWNMIERPAIIAITRFGMGESAVLFLTFSLTILRDLTEAIITGLCLSALLWIRRGRTKTTSYNQGDKRIYTFTGPLNFITITKLKAQLERAPPQIKTLELDCRKLSQIDSSSAHILEQLIHKSHKGGIHFTITGLSDKHQGDLRRFGLVV